MFRSLSALCQTIRRNGQRRENRRRLQELSGGWTTTLLERRIMLSADGSQAIASATDNAGDTATFQTGRHDDRDVAGAVDRATIPSRHAASEIVFVDGRVEQAEQILHGIDPHAEIILLDTTQDGLDQISQTLASRKDVGAIHVIAHGASGKLELGNQIVSQTTLQARTTLLHRWSDSLAPRADILLYGCHVGSGPAGAAFLETLANLTGADVAASTNATGAAAGPVPADADADWVLERTVGTIETQVVVAPSAQRSYRGILPITIYAAGTTNVEEMQLLVDGTAVQTWSGVGGNADAGTFVAYNFATPAGMTPDRIRVAFTNDLWDPANGIDRNLRVDRIVLDGVTYQTESPTVYSTGTWKPEDGVTPGFRTSEYLHAGGYFQYAPVSGGSGSQITIRANGEQGGENMELRIDNILVQTWNNLSTTPQEFSFTANTTVTPDRVRVAFTNDLWQPANNIDRNLRVDWIRIDNQTFQTESPVVFSSATWKPEDGIVGGFRQSEVLHANGYFQYATESPPNPGVVSLQNSVINVNETAGSAVVNVVRNNGSAGTITVDYRTIAGTATPGSDYSDRSGTLTFLSGETVKPVSIPLINDSAIEGNETVFFTIDNVQGGATLLVPRTATITIGDDDLILPNFAQFTSSAGLVLNGNASVTSNVLQLTPANTNQRGSAFFNSHLPVDANTSFQTSFQFRITGGTNGADGLVFMLQNSSAGLNALGTNGNAVGYRGIGNSLAVEFDTYQAESDPNNNHISVFQNGNINTALVTRTAPMDLNSGNPVYAWVDYSGTTDLLTVYVASTNTKPSQPLMSVHVDLPSIVGSRAYMGFSAATGGLTNAHQIQQWQLTNTSPPTTDPPSGNVSRELITSGLNLPTAVDWADNGQNMLIAQQNGIVRVVRNGQLLATPFLDISAQVNGTRDRGLLDIAVHPDFANNPYVYLLYTYDPPETANFTGLAGRDGNGNRAGRLTRVTANAATNYTTALPGSEVVLLGTNSTWNNFNGFVNSTFNFTEPPAGILPDGTNLRDFINSDSESHTVGAVEFGPDGALYVSIGDGASYNQVDPRAVRVQDIDNLSGKILRINPLNGNGLPDNPFYNGDSQANRSKVYQYGLRNPFRMTVHPTTGQVYVGDVGWGAWEEVNAAGPGANFGWPYFEGGSGTSIRSGYQSLPEAQAFYASGQSVTPSLFALNHSIDGINAIVMGDVYTANVYPSRYVGDIFINDLGQGIVRNLSLNASGAVDTVETFTTGANVVVQIKLGPDGRLYYVDLDNGQVGRWVIA